MFISRSITGTCTGVVALALLFVVSVSMVEVATLTLLVSVVPRVFRFGRTITVTVCCAPLAMVPRLHDSVLLLALVVLPAAGAAAQVPAEGLAETNVTFEGRVSVIVTASAADNPLAMLVAVMT